MPDIRWSWIDRHLDDIWQATVEHLVLVGLSVAAAACIAIPLAILVRHHRIGATASVGITTIVYTIPSLALFAILVSIVGIGRTTAVIGLAAYATGVLLRSALTGLRTVPTAPVDAARGMGMTRRQILWRVEMPLALPGILTGVRLATIETVAIATIAVFVAGGGLGGLIYTDGIQRDLYFTPILTGTVIAIAMAVVLDVALLAAQRAVTRWQRVGRV